MTSKAARPAQNDQPAKRVDPLDEALAESFPASDPPAATNITGAGAARVDQHAKRAHDQAESDLLDEALDESFPASDPPAVTLKHGKDDADPA